MPRRLVVRRSLAAASSALLLLAGCGGDSTGTVAKAVVASIRITPANPTIDAGHSIQVAATPLDAHGTELTGRTVTWTVPEGALVSINANGTVSGLAPGVDTVFAVSEGVMQPLIVTVSGASLNFNVVPPAALVSYGTPLQLTVNARNQFGEVIAGPVTWTSLNPDIASVNSSGLVVGVSTGHAQIQVSIGIAQKIVPVDVWADTIDTNGELALSGARDFTTVTVRPNGHLTANGTTIVRSFGPIVIDGMVTSNAAACSLVSIESRSTVTITGTVDVGCALHIVALGGFRMQGATIRSRGLQWFTNDTTLQPSNYTTVSETAAPLACEFVGASMSIGPAINTTAQDWRTSCRGDVKISGPTVVQGQDGATGTNPLNLAGRVLIFATRDIAVPSGDVFLGSGNGGNGLSAVSIPALYSSGNALAGGGKGGNVGSVSTPPIWLQAARNIHLPSGSGSLTLHLGNGGSGGDALAVGVDGPDASSTMSAMNGMDAVAFGGLGGDVAAPGIVAPAGVVGGTIQIAGGNGGKGGDVIATGGKGGRGSATFVDGASGGALTATGGTGGQTAVIPTGSYVTRGGAGGSASIFGGEGGGGFNACSLLHSSGGGRGGQGGSGRATPGVGGSAVTVSSNTANGANGSVQVSNAGNGGNGGNGSIPGAGGEPGQDIPSSVVGSRIVIGRAFTAGVPGAACP